MNAVKFFYWLACKMKQAVYSIYCTTHSQIRISFTKMLLIRRQVLADCVVHYHKNVAEFDKKNTIRHFVEQQVPRTTISRIIAKFLQYGEVKYQKCTSRTVSPQIIKLQEKV